MRGDNQSIVHGLTAAGEQFPEGHAMPLRLGHRTIFRVPLLRKEEAIGRR